MLAVGARQCELGPAVLAYETANTRCVFLPPSALAKAIKGTDRIGLPVAACWIGATAFWRSQR